MRSALIVLISGFLTWFVAACQTVALSPYDKVPPVFQAFSAVDIPNYVGNNPTPFDGQWEGYYFIEIDTLCYRVASMINNIVFVIKNGVFTAVDGEFDSPNGFVNKAGTYMMTLRHVEDGYITSSGTIKGDRFLGRWIEWNWGCSGRYEMARITGGKFYCLDRFDNTPYVGNTHCRGVDRDLTKAEYDGLMALPMSRIKNIGTPLPPIMPIEKHLAILMGNSAQTPTPTASPPLVQPKTTATVERRLGELRNLIDKGLLTPDEAAEKRKEILNSL